MVDPLPQEVNLPDEHRLHARLMDALMSQVNVTVYYDSVPPPTHEQFLATLLAVVTQIAAGEYGANRPAFAESPWQPEQPGATEQPGTTELLAYHLLVDKIEARLAYTLPHLGHRDDSTAAWHRDVYLRILASERVFDLLVRAGYLIPCRSDPRYYHYSYTPNVPGG